MLEKILLTDSPKWNKTCVNISFLRSLFSRFGTKTFTNKDAYVVYYKKHLMEDAKYPRGKVVHRRGGKNPRIVSALLHPYVIVYLSGEGFAPRVRNVLCAASCLGDYGLIKIKNGMYKFKKSGIPKTYYICNRKKRTSSYYTHSFKRY